MTVTANLIFKKLFYNSFLIILLLSITAFSQQSSVIDTYPQKPENVTWSEHLKNIESDSILKNKIFDFEMNLTRQVFKSSPLSKGIESVLFNRMNKLRIIKSYVLTDNSTLQLIDNGLGQSIDLTRTLPDKSQQKLFSNFDIKKNNSVNFVGFAVSPSEKYVVIFAEKNGSIDDYELIILNLITGKRLESSLIAKGEGTASISWFNQSAFYFTDSSLKKMTVNLDLSTTPAESNINYWGNYPFNLMCEKNIVYFVNSKKEPKTQLKLDQISCGEWTSLLNISDHSVQMLTKSKDIKNSIRLLNYLIPETENPNIVSVSAETVFQTEQQVYKSSFNIDNLNIISTYWGAEQSLFLINSQTKSFEKLLLPSYASVKSISRGLLNKTLKINLMTKVTTDREYEYDYLEHKWILEPTVSNDLLTKEGKAYVDQIILVSARDGVKLPVRLTYAKSTVLNENTPALIHIYGGYGKAGDFYPEFDFYFRNLFIDQGGVLISPILRGGNEFGEEWHTQAVQDQRMTSFFDLIDIAQYLSTQKISSAKKIIVTGTSAGGLVTLASGLLAPEIFGLLIPVSPPTDILAKFRLDSRFGGQPLEYGNPHLTNIADYMKKYSPLEQNINLSTLPDILLLAGVNDSRVNFTHSLKMAMKLRKENVSSGKFNSVFIKNSVPFESLWD